MLHVATANRELWSHTKSKRKRLEKVQLVSEIDRGQKTNKQQTTNKKQQIASKHIVVSATKAATIDG